jgi:methylmalonyl-CoA mutase C-terminal domain/subunit
MEERRIRVLLAKPGLDGHETGVKLMARALRDAGMEVVYSGPRQTPKTIVATAVQEAIDVIGLSILSGAHKELTSRVMRQLKQEKAEDIYVLVGGIIPEDDVPILIGMGVKGVFGPGTKISTVVDFIEGLISSKIKQR